MNEYIVTTDELMDFACHFLIEGEKGVEYDDFDLSEAIKRAKFQRLTRCRDCIHALPCERRDDSYRCTIGSKNFRYTGEHFCINGKPEGDQNER